MDNKGVIDMLTKLRSDYQIVEVTGNGGHMIGFYNEKNERINKNYRFNKGTYRLEETIPKDPTDTEQHEFCWFYYQPKKQG